MAGDWSNFRQYYEICWGGFEGGFYVSNAYVDFINFSFVCNSDYLQVQKINKIEKAMGRQKST
ncbi:hypothetical protein IQ283_20125 [Alkalihalobacillus hwajinpoensis]|nr:hypothetical protein [Pseudalkalibacillus hwajinpoensis]